VHALVGVVPEWQLYNLKQIEPSVINAFNICRVNQMCYP
jgi:hypothetical protein